MSRRSLWALTAAAAVLLSVDVAGACGRRGSHHCAVSCCPSPCAPCFDFRARLKNPSGYVDPERPLPIEVILTNYECYWWHYEQSEYGFYVFDDQGHYVPDALLVPYLDRQIWVPPAVSILDEPVGIRLRKGAVQLGKTYTLIITLRGHSSYLRFTPLLEEKGKEAAASASPATIVVELPADATLTIDGDPTTSTSERRVFSTPALPEGRAFHYTLEATVIREGKAQSVTRRVAVRAGQETRVGLDIPQATVAATK